MYGIKKDNKENEPDIDSNTNLSIDYLCSSANISFLYLKNVFWYI